MMQLRKRVEGLETRMSPAALRESHLIGMRLGETESDALARYGQPIDEDDFVVFLVPGVRDEAA